MKNYYYIEHMRMLWLVREDQLLYPLKKEEMKSFFWGRNKKYLLLPITNLCEGCAAKGNPLRCAFFPPCTRTPFTPGIWERIYKGAHYKVDGNRVIWKKGSREFEKREKAGIPYPLS